MIYFHTVDLRSAIKCSTITIDHFRPFISDKTMGTNTRTLTLGTIPVLFVVTSLQTADTFHNSEGFAFRAFSPSKSNQPPTRSETDDERVQIHDQGASINHLPARISAASAAAHHSEFRSEDNSAAFTFKMSQSRARAIRGKPLQSTETTTTINDDKMKGKIVVRPFASPSRARNSSCGSLDNGVNIFQSRNGTDQDDDDDGADAEKRRQ